MDCSFFIDFQPVFVIYGKMDKWKVCWLLKLSTCPPTYWAWANYQLKIDFYYLFHSTSNQILKGFKKGTDNSFLYSSLSFPSWSSDFSGWFLCMLFPLTWSTSELRLVAAILKTRAFPISLFHLNNENPKLVFGMFEWLEFCFKKRYGPHKPSQQIRPRWKRATLILWNKPLKSNLNEQ